MTYTTVPVEQFGGLQLAADPREVGWAGAIDLLDVDFDRPGRIRSRDGYATFTAATASRRYVGLGAYVHGELPSFDRLLAARQDGTSAVAVVYEALDYTGTVTNTQTTGDGLDHTSNHFIPTAAIGTTSGRRVYIGHPGATPSYYFNGTAFTSEAWVTSSRGLAVQYPGNRLVNFDSNSRVMFSDPGDPSTGGVNYELVNPGDGETPAGAANFGDLVLCFKQSYFAVFYGNTTNASGSPLFNWRAIRGAGSEAGGAVVTAPDGIYFLARDGVYRTTGGRAEKLSVPLDPLFGIGQIPSYYQGSAINFGEVTSTVWTGTSITAKPIRKAQGTYWNGRVLISVPTGTSAINDTTLVYNTVTGTWSVWSVDVNCATVFPRSATSGDRDLYFGYPSPGSKDIGRLNSTYSTDAGAGIASRYRSGFRQIEGRRPDGKSRLRQWRLKGTGTVTFGVAADGATSIPTTGGGAQASVTLVDAPKANYRIAQMGNTHSWQVSSSSSAWRLDEIEADAG